MVDGVDRHFSKLPYRIKYIEELGILPVQAVHFQLFIFLLELSQDLSVENVASDTGLLTFPNGSPPDVTTERLKPLGELVRL